MADQSFERGIEFFRTYNARAADGLEAALADVSPDLMRYAAAFPFGEIYQREGMDLRARQITTLATLATLGAQSQLRVHIGIARKMGLSKEEIAEVFIQLAPYAGFPAAINATLTLSEVIEDETKATT